MSSTQDESASRMHRSLVRIQSIPNDGRPITDYIPAWNSNIIIEIPNDAVPAAVRAKLKPEFYLLIDVNIGAARAEDLCFGKLDPDPIIDPSTLPLL